MKLIKHLLFLLILTPLLGCNSIYWQLPNKGSRHDYLWTFYGLHRPLTPNEKIEGKNLFKDYINANKIYELDDLYGTNSAYSMWVIDNECNAEENIYKFDERIK
jgi:hypothetical protein